jgi:hypothetical protein
MKIETKTLSDGTKQIGYHDGQGWVGITCMYRSVHPYGPIRYGWKSDRYPGIRSLTEWKKIINDVYVS